MKSVAQEGRKVKPILPTTPSRSTDRTISRTNLTSLKPAEDFFYSFFPPFPLNSFFLSVLLSFFIPSSLHPLPFLFPLPAFFYLFICFLLKFLLILPLISFYSFFLPSFPFLFPFFLLPFFLPPFLFFPQVRQENLEC